MTNKQHAQRHTSSPRLEKSQTQKRKKYIPTRDKKLTHKKKETRDDDDDHTDIKKLNLSNQVNTFTTHTHSTIKKKN
jgi:protein subunit release factor B